MDERVLAKLWTEAEDLSARIPVGTPVRYWTGAKGHGPGDTGRIWHAFTVVGGSVCGWVDTHRACIAATHIEVEE